MQNISAKNLAIGSLVLSLIAYAFVPILIRWSEVEISPEATIFNRYWIAALILACWQFLQIIRNFDLFPFVSCRSIDLQFFQDLSARQATILEADITENSKHLYLTWGTTILAYAIAPVFWAWSLTETSVANSALIHSLTPLFTTVGSWLVFKTQFERQFWLGTLIAVGGATVLGFNDFQLDFHRIKGDILALTSAIFFAIGLMATERLQTQANTMQMVFWFSLAGAVVMLLITCMLGEPVFPVSFQGWLAVFTLAIVGQLLAVGFVTYSLSQLSASLVALVFLLDPVLTAIAAWFAFEETLNLSNAISFAIVLLGVYLGLTAKQ
ncbi:DMT family transporter [Oscillatoria salina]|uniref:DMT family transporter n=1 Tax=Oscillatoria salina TaxID=331517 RepID=UPI001CCC0499|nr:DMT family transporter [Oscillatoria salina]MBZ8181481.1 DMT family transporter [Oscillatoria salina IIICB1]